MRGLREQHRQATNNEQTKYPQVGEAVIINDGEKNRNQRRLAIVTALIVGRVSVVRLTRLKTAKGNLERAI